MKTAIRGAIAALSVVLIVGCGSSGSNDVRSRPTTNVDDPGLPSSIAGDGEGSPSASTAEENETLEPAEPAVARASDYVGGNIDPDFGTGEPGELSVIAVGNPDGEADSIPFVVRNNTSGAVYDISATGKATAEGRLVASGEDHGIDPTVVAPGEIAFGYVYFSSTPPAGSVIEVSVTANSEVDDYFVPMIIGEANLIEGDYDAQVVGEVTAPADIEVDGPVSVSVLCVDEEANLTDVFSGYTDGDASIVPGGSATYSVGIYGDVSCETFLIGSSGYNANYWE